VSRFGPQFGHPIVSHSPARLVVMLLGALACTPSGADAEPSPKPEIAKPAEPAPTTEPEPKPELEPDLLPPGTPEVPGFVLYTQEQTIIVPTDGSPHTIGEGLWVQDDRVSPPALRHTLILSETRTATMGLPRCPCLALEGACEDDWLESRTFDSRNGNLLRNPKRPCTCMRRHEVAGSPPMEIDGEQFEACVGDGEEILMSMVAGRLFYQGWEWNGACFDAFSVYDQTDSEYRLIQDPPDLSNEGMRLLGCDYEFGTSVGRAWPLDHGPLHHECENDCEDYCEPQSYLLRRGDLWGIGDDIAFGGGTRLYWKRTARPESCPSVNDPCGDPQPFRAKARLDRKRREFWIATDGQFALTADGHDYALWRADGDTAIEFELPGIHASTDVIGVRAHADVGRLRALIGKHTTLGLMTRAHATTTMPPSACLDLVGLPQPGTTARELGNTCFIYIGIQQWTDAEKACLQGLALADEPETRGAILFNLGSIAEAQGAIEQAALYYRESLEARPGKPAVERKLAKLKLPGAP
jgi:hypothetical protein